MGWYFRLQKYYYTTKNINKAVKRNIDRFPENFCFQLTEEKYKSLRFKNFTLNEANSKDEIENNSLRSQIATSSKNENIKHRGKKYLPYVFTEQGISMLSGVLENEIAVKVSVNIIRAFVEMRKMIL